MDYQYVGREVIDRLNLSQILWFLFKKIGSPTSITDLHLHLIDAKELQQRDWLCSMKHVHRKANSCADWVVTYSYELSPSLYIFDSPPRDIYSLLVTNALGIVWPRFM
ncbi:hypothetical protein REPUB_Repub04eG0075700 [Reevesia pubescens]